MFCRIIYLPKYAFDQKLLDYSAMFRKRKLEIDNEEKTQWKMYDEKC